MLTIKETMLFFIFAALMMIAISAWRIATVLEACAC